MTLHGTCPECGRRIGIRKERRIGAAWEFLITRHQVNGVVCRGWGQHADPRVPITRSREP